MMDYSAVVKAVVEVDFVYNNSAGAAEAGAAVHSKIAVAVAVVEYNTTDEAAHCIDDVAVLPSLHYHLCRSNSEGVVEVELCPEVGDDTVIVYSWALPCFYSIAIRTLSLCCYSSILYDATII